MSRALARGIYCEEHAYGEKTHADSDVERAQVHSKLHNRLGRQTDGRAFIEGSRHWLAGHRTKHLTFSGYNSLALLRPDYR